MAAHWYCRINDREHGPFTSDKIQRLAAGGKLKPADSVRPETDRHWTPASAIPGLFPDSSEHPAPPVAKAAPPKVAKKRASTATRQAPPPAPGQPTAVASPVPKAIPVDGDNAAIPAAKPVATPVAKPVAAPVAAPVATPVAVPVAQPAVAVVAAAPPAPGEVGRSASDLAHRGKRKSQQLYIVVGGLAAAILILGGIAVFVFSRGPRPKVQELAAAAPEQTDPAPTTDDPESDPTHEVDSTVEAASAPAQPSKMPPLTKWLDATRQSGGLRGVVKLGIPNVWLKSGEAGDQTLNIDVKITNLQPDLPLDFKGFDGAAGRSANTQVFLANNSGALLQQATTGTASDSAKRYSHWITPREVHTHSLSFSIENSDAEHYRLALPYAALGHTGYLGFEIPRLMVKDNPPGEAEMATDGTTTDSGTAEDPMRVEESPRRTDGEATVEPDAEPNDAEVNDGPRPGGQPETISDLLRSIDGDAQEKKPTDGQDE